MTALETAISGLQAKHEDPKHTKELENRIDILEARESDEFDFAIDNLEKIQLLKTKTSDIEGDIKMLDDMASDNMLLISANAAKVASNELQIKTNSYTIASNAAVAIDSN